ncbi:MAG: energy-coupling factor ABC transporter ATP-binding protein [Microcoleaceae cyanobacterium]
MRFTRYRLIAATSQLLFNSLKLDRVSLLSSLSPYPILQEISATIQRGDRIALVGSSGAGKTSLLRLLNRLSSPTHGKIELNQQDYQSIPPVQLRQQVTLVLQEPKLLGMTVQEAIAYPLKLRGLNPTEITQRVSTWMERLQIPQDWLNRTELQLSTGQKQWVAIARALAIQSQVLLLDEPLFSLDLQQQITLVNLLEALTPSDMTILMATHGLEQAEKFSTRLWHLHKGKLILDEAKGSVNWQTLEAELDQAKQQEAQAWGEI